jgi:hypothetical protein
MALAFNRDKVAEYPLLFTLSLKGTLLDTTAAAAGGNLSSTTCALHV